MPDAPSRRTATYEVLTVGYVAPKTAATASYVHDEDLHVVFDPGMVADRKLLLDPLARLGLAPGDVTDVVLSHHHPDNIMNVGLFGNARVHDHKAIYRDDEWTYRDAEGYALTPSIVLIKTPGHSDQDISMIVGTADGVVAFAGDLWWTAEGPTEDPVAPNRDNLRRSRARIMAVADLIVPGHGAPFTPDRSTPS